MVIVNLYVRLFVIRALLYLLPLTKVLYLLLIDEYFLNTLLIVTYCIVSTEFRVRFTCRFLYGWFSHLSFIRNKLKEMDVWNGVIVKTILVVSLEIVIGKKKNTNKFIFLIVEWSTFLCFSFETLWTRKLKTSRWV